MAQAQQNTEQAALVAMTVVQPVITPPLLEQSSFPVTRVDFPVQNPQDNAIADEQTSQEELEGQRGIATMWLKENQLMLTYFVAGE